jgi:hypothetical protein
MLKEQYEKTKTLLRGTKQALRKFMADNHIVPFRIGFEFQMSGGMLPWASQESYNIQKEPIFEVHCQGKKLWHIEIDGDEIEFVTEPFAYFELEELRVCMQSIYHAIDCLKDEKHADVSFQDWLNKLGSISKYKVVNKEIFSNLASKKISIDNAKAYNFGFKPQATIQCPLKWIADICYKLFYKTTYNEILLGATPLAEVEKDQQPLFRTTIGGLMFLQAETMIGITRANIVAIEACKKKEKYENKDYLKGLPPLLQALMVGLHSLQDDATLIEAIRLEKLELFSQENLSRSDMLILSHFPRNAQVDAKTGVPCLSRRPFSEMLKEVKAKSTRKSVDFVHASEYAKAFTNTMNDNKIFTTILSIPTTLYLANYAEIFYTEDGKRRDLSMFLDSFYESCYKDKYRNHKEDLRALLSNGAASTTMIRNLRDQQIPFDVSYYQRVVESVEHPTARPQLIMNKKSYKKKVEIKEEKWQYDLLSPPFPLETGIHKKTPSRHQDSMGAFNLGPNEYRTCEFGEAVVEFRNISAYPVDPSFHSDGSCFLGSQQYLEIDAMELFQIINDIDNPQNLNDTEQRVVSDMKVANDKGG